MKVQQLKMRTIVSVIISYDDGDQDKISLSKTLNNVINKLHNSNIEIVKSHDTTSLFHEKESVIDNSIIQLDGTIEDQFESLINLITD